MSEKRFEKVYSQGAIDVMEVWVDKETGVNYLYHYSGNSGGLTPLLDRDGKPVITTVIKEKTRLREPRFYFSFFSSRTKFTFGMPLKTQGTMSASR